MKIIKVAQNKQVAWIMSAEQFVNELPDIKRMEVNAISIRDSEKGLSEKLRQQYAQIDAAGLQNLFVATFDDLAEPFEQNKGLIFPESNHITEILNWAKQRWEENGKVFIVHCTGGVSRSSAIAMLISQMIQGEYNNIFDVNIHAPNTKVLEFGEEHLGTNTIQEDVQKQTEAWGKQWRQDEGLEPL